MFEEKLSEIKAEEAKLSEEIRSVSESIKATEELLKNTYHKEIEELRIEETAKLKAQVDDLKTEILCLEMDHQMLMNEFERAYQLHYDDTFTKLKQSKERLKELLDLRRIKDKEYADLVDKQITERIASIKDTLREKGFTREVQTIQELRFNAEQLEKELSNKNR